jgi:hypothetical protein
MVSGPETFILLQFYIPFLFLIFFFSFYFFPFDEMTELLLKHQPTGWDAEGVTPKLLRLKFYCV